MLRQMQTRLSSLFRRGRYERELDSELRFHLDMLTEQNIRMGLAPDQARRAALLTFGGVDRVKDDVRDTWLSRVAETLVQDVRYGLRSIGRSRGFACVIAITMGLGIGANAAIFSVVNGVLLKPLPYADGYEVIALSQHEPLAGNADIGFSYKEILDYRTARSLEGVVEFHNMWFILLGRAEPQRVSTGVVSANFFDILGVTPMYGRTFVDADDKPGAPAVLVLSHSYWKDSFGGDPTIVGKVFQMNDRPHQVIGVLPPIPQYPAQVDVYMPTSACPFRSDPRTVENRNARMVGAFARMKDGISLSKAQADLDLVAARLEQEYPDFYPAARGHRTVATSLHEEMTVNFRATLLVLLGTAGFVLLIVCASVANLMLARLVRRERELAVRSAMGATRGRLLRQLLTESTLLAILGGVVGLAIALWSVDLLVAFAAQFTARAAEIAVDTSVLLYTLAISVATGLVVGSIPALSGKLTDVSSLREGTRTTQSRHAMRSALIVVQVAASFMLLIGAGLTIRSLLKIQQVDPGIDTENILTMRIDLNFTKYLARPANVRAAIWERIEEAIRNRPGVSRVGGAATFPLNERGPFSGSLTISGRELLPDVNRPTVDVRVATPDYFATVGQAVVSGRPFRESDRMGQSRVVIVNQTMARHYWPGASPLGARLSGDGGETWQTVVGVVADTRQQLNENPKDEVYIPMFQTTQLSTMWLVRSNVEPETMAREIRAAVQMVDPEQPVDNFRTLADVRSASIAPRKLTATLLGLFGLLALIITATGIAGVIAFSVNQRTQEFGVMMALGAPRVNVLAMVLRQGLQLVLIGLAIGLGGALVLTRMLTTMLFGIEPTDGITFVAVSMVLIAVAALACLVPAKRAASVDPMIALRAV
jgi:putative ABC transport system permease protein